MRKYGSWSIAHGLLCVSDVGEMVAPGTHIKQGIATVLFSSSPNMWGNEDAQLDAPWMPRCYQRTNAFKWPKGILTAEVDAPNVGAFIESEDGTGLVESDMLREADNVLVKRTPHILELKAPSAFRVPGRWHCTLTSEKMNVLAGSKPMAMMSLALLLQ